MTALQEDVASREEVTGSGPLGKAWWQRVLLTLEPMLLNSSETEHCRSHHQSPANVRDTAPWCICLTSLISGSLHPTLCTTPHSLPLPHLDTFLGNLRCQSPKTPHLLNRRGGQASGEWVRKEETRGAEVQRTAGTGEPRSFPQGEVLRVESVETACSLLRRRRTKKGTGKGLDLIG